MKKKIFFLLIGWMLVASSAYAQSSIFIIGGDDEEEEVVQPQDTAQTLVEPQITILDRVWDLNLEKSLEDEIIRLSKATNCERISKSDISQWVYKVRSVPTKTGTKTVYLSLLNNRDYFLSLENPVDLEEVCKCYLELTKPDEVKNPGKHQTDDKKEFGEAKTNGDDKKVINLW